MIRNGIRQHTVLRAAAALFLLTVLACVAACSPWEIGAEKDVVKNGIEFETFREMDDGSKIGKLAKNTVIDGWPCKQGFIVFHPDWRLDELQLSRDYERNGIAMPEGTWVFPDRHGNPGICMFPRDVEVQGYLCRGSWMGKEGVMTAFYPGGRLHWFYSRDPVVVDGVICKDTVFEAVYLHENGRLKQCKLDEATTIEGVAYSSGTVIRMDDNGKALNK
jgi:hypothetical protein